MAANEEDHEKEAGSLSDSAVGNELHDPAEKSERERERDEEEMRDEGKPEKVGLAWKC